MTENRTPMITSASARAPRVPVTTPRARPSTTHVAPAPSHAAPAPSPANNCDPAYPGACLPDGIGDYDCASGSGNGPNYVNGPLAVRPPDPFGLDSDHDGIGCERG